MVKWKAPCQESLESYGSEKGKDCSGYIVEWVELGEIGKQERTEPRTRHKAGSNKGWGLLWWSLFGAKVKLHVLVCIQQDGMGTVELIFTWDIILAWGGPVWEVAQQGSRCPPGSRGILACRPHWHDAWFSPLRFNRNATLFQVNRNQVMLQFHNQINVTTAIIKFAPSVFSEREIIPHTGYLPMVLIIYCMSWQQKSFQTNKCSKNNCLIAGPYVSLL